MVLIFRSIEYSSFYFSVGHNLALILTIQSRATSGCKYRQRHYYLPQRISEQLRLTPATRSVEFGAELLRNPYHSVGVMLLLYLLVGVLPVLHCNVHMLHCRSTYIFV